MKYGLLGEVLGHSYSKEIHELLADYTYDMFEVKKKDFKEFMERRDFRAINVTIPYKCDVIPYLSSIEDNAKAIGAVNCIVNHDGLLHGYNTDYSGFLYMLKQHDVNVSGRKCVVLGNGGAKKAIYAVLKDEGASPLIVVNRHAGKGVISYETCYETCTDTEIIVNTTPVGMYPNLDVSPIDLAPFVNCHTVVDIIANPLQTKLLKQAEALGKKQFGGLEMLVAQAKYACEIFTDTHISDERIPEICRKYNKNFSRT